MTGFLAVRAALKIEKKLNLVVVGSGKICPANLGVRFRTLTPVEAYLQGMVLDLGSLDTVSVFRGNGTIGISYKSRCFMSKAILGLSLRVGNHREDKKGSKNLKNK